MNTLRCPLLIVRLIGGADMVCVDYFRYAWA